MRIHIIYIAALFSILISGCGNDRARHDATPDVIDRFDLSIYDYPELDTDSQRDFASRYKPVIDLLPSIESGSDSSLLEYSLSAGVRRFTPDIKARFTMQDSIDYILYKVKENLTATVPGIRDRAVYGIVSTFNQSIILNDSTLLLGLNHYLGSDYPGYEYFDIYLRHNKTPQHLPYDFAEAVIKSDFKYLPSPEHPDLLSLMLYEGAVMYVIGTIMPEYSENELLGYEPWELEWLQKHEKSLWDGLVSQKLLYSTDPLVAARLISPAPRSASLNPEAPGRAARYIGYRIVKSYMKHNSDTSPAELLSPDFYNDFSTLVNAKYNP